MTYRVLFIAPTRIGDAVLAASLLEHIRTATPEARVTIIASPFYATRVRGSKSIQRRCPRVIVRSRLSSIHPDTAAQGVME